MDRTTPLTVTDLTRQIKGTLENVFPPLWVEGELTDFSAASSGHCYFTVKDENSQIRAVMFRREAGRLPFLPEDGMSVLLLGRLTVYEARGNYQLIVDDMEPRGLGAIMQALEQLRVRLEAEGLFDADRKKDLPAFPACIGVVTSPTGAAIRDITKVLRDRDAPVRVLLSPALVQGRDAPDSIVTALEALVENGEAEVIIIGRGGGSFEDLLAFSEETVVRAVAQCPVPIVSAVGHEIDISLCDLAADLRAPTPSAAAEMVSESKEGLMAGLQYVASRLAAAMRIATGDAKSLVAAVGSRLTHPRHLLEQGKMRLDDLSFRLVSHTRARLTGFRSHLKNLSGLLHSLGPQAVLDRGYAVVQKEDGSVVKNPKQVWEGEALNLRVAAGKIRVKVGGGKGKETR
ncbi:MAG: exodeoxyribonuclease VII large subunit [bacterium]|nr:exodeoxyribonuclease VII large subunit [bacterium]MDT8365340.1 exodeoxyribonuclease VII large subunit [bacterium]